MKFNIIEHYNSIVIEIKDDLIGGPDAALFQEIIQKQLSENKLNFVVDLGKVKFVNSSGMGILIRGYTTITNAGGKFVLANINEKMKGLLSITKLSTIITVYDNVDEATKNF